MIAKRQLIRQYLVVVTQIPLFSCMQTWEPAFSGFFDGEYGISKYSPALFTTLSGCWWKKELTVCTVCSEIGGVSRPVLFKTEQMVKTISTKLNILQYQMMQASAFLQQSKFVLGLLIYIYSIYSSTNRWKGFNGMLEEEVYYWEPRRAIMA